MCYLSPVDRRLTRSCQIYETLPSCIATTFVTIYSRFKPIELMGIMGDLVTDMEHIIEPDRFNIIISVLNAYALKPSLTGRIVKMKTVKAYSARVSGLTQL